jgi:hypothetical protein
MNDVKWEHAAHDLGDLRREMQEGHGGSLVNMLVGLIINACDAYERIQYSGTREIHIEVERNTEKTASGRTGRGRIRVVDWAEGMDVDDFSRNFGSYGSAKSGWAPGKKIGGLFGREASDIMWSNVASRYICIKNGRGYYCEFRPVVDFRRGELDRRFVKQLQDMYKAKKRNLTVAEFYLHEDYRFPQLTHLINGLKRHFRLRLINSNPEVKILLQCSDSRGKRKPEQICFARLETEGEGADLVDSQEFQLSYKHYPPFRAEARLYRKHDRDLSQSGTDREGGAGTRLP